MGIFQKLFGKKDTVPSGSIPRSPGTQASILAVLPEQIYENASLELQDVIAPSALKIESNQSAWAIKSPAHFS